MTQTMIPAMRILHVSFLQQYFVVYFFECLCNINYNCIKKKTFITNFD